MRTKQRSLVAAMCVALAAGLLAFTAPAQEVKTTRTPVKVEIPASLAPKLKKLPKEKLDFLLSEKNKGFAARPELLFKRFETKTPKEIEAYIDGMMAVVEESKFHPGKDEPSVALNTETEGFNGWKVKRPAAFDPPRAPGPINLNRYMGSGPKLGIPTFFNLPVALTPEDLKAGKVDVAIVGAGLDMGSGFRGAADGPRRAHRRGL